MKAHCLFEQSGTFKNEFKKLGIEAYDYDILNDYGQTDYQIDLYSEIEKAYRGGRAYLIAFRRMISFLHSFHVQGLKLRFFYLFGDNNIRTKEKRILKSLKDA